MLKNRHLLVTFLMLLGAASVSLAVYYLSPTPRLALPPVVNEQKENLPAEELKPAELKSAPPAETKTEITPAPEEENFISAQMVIGEKKYETQIASGSNAYDLMKKISETQGLQFSTKEYSGLGHFVEEINNIKNDKQKGIYWIFYINNQSSQLGVSSYILKNNDIISWKYETAQF